jgi:hypothetical protein
MSITIYRLPAKESKLLCSVFRLQNKRKFAVSVFRLQQINRRCPFPLVPFSVYKYIYWNSSIRIDIYIDISMYLYIYPYLHINIYILIYIAVNTKNGSPSNFPQSVYCLLNVQTEVCPLSVCLRRNKWKFSVCKQTNRTKRTIRTCPSMVLCMRGVLCLIDQEHSKFCFHTRSMLD